MTSVDTPKSAQKNTTDSIEHNTDKKESLNASADSIHSTTKSAVSTPPSKSEIKNQLQDSSLEKQQQEINQQDQPKLRRSSRRNNRSDQDPIIAPGFGTAKDIARLSAQLSEDSGIILPPEAIVAMMNSRGEGITSSRRSRSNQAADDEENDTAPVPGSSAWADFMKEEATDNKKSKSDDETSQQDAAAKSERKRTYDIQEDTKKKSKPEPAVADEEDEDLFEQHCGVLVQTGTMDSTIVGRNKVKIENPPGYNLMEPTKILPDVIVRTVHTSSNSCHSIAISQKYDVYGWGRNEVSQLAGNLPDEVVLPTILDLPKHAKVISAATGKSHTLFLYDDGSVYAIGFNKVGQCGVKANLDNITTYRKCVFQSGGDVVDVQIKQVACGEDFSMAVSVEGHLYSAGSAEFGQLGNGETGEHIVQAGKTGFNNSNCFVRRTTFCHAPAEKLYTSGGNSKEKVIPLDDEILIDKVACGKHHSLAVEMASDEPPRVFSWGCGSYGCLGHGVQADEYFPRLVGTLVSAVKSAATHPTSIKAKSVMSVSAGSLCSLLQLPNGHVHYWGKHRSIGEATMRPSLIDSLANNAHIVRYVDAGAQTVILSTANAVTVAWGQGPHGELGLGATKSSAKPAFIPALDSCRVASLACGYGHTLYVIRNDDDEDKKAVKKIKQLNSDDCQPLIDAAEAKTSKREKQPSK